MSIQIDESIKQLFEEHHKKNIDLINDKISGIFLYGVIVGIIVSYSGLLGYVAGVGSGIILANKFSIITNQVNIGSSNIFDNIITQIKSFKTSKID
jgi:hypothetical protein